MRTATASRGDQIAGGDPPRVVIRLVSNPRNSDYALAQAAARGGVAAMGDLYERHNRRVYSVCLGMTRNSAEAEDLTQEVFVHLLRKIGSFRGDSQFSTWLYRLTVNLVLMHFRRRAGRPQQVPTDLEQLLILRHDRKRANAQMTERIALDSALAQLPTGCRSVFVLFDIEGYKHDEIANLLGCSVGTSKSQLHRARMKLRRLLRSSLPNWS